MSPLLHGGSGDLDERWEVDGNRCSTVFAGRVIEDWKGSLIHIFALCPTKRSASIA